MTHEKEPPRLASVASEVPDSVRDLLRAGQGDGGTVEELQRLEADIVRTVGQGSWRQSVSSTAAAGVLSSAAWKTTAVLLAVGASGALGYRVWTEARSSEGSRLEAPRERPQVVEVGSHSELVDGSTEPVEEAPALSTSEAQIGEPEPPRGREPSRHVRRKEGHAAEPAPAPIEGEEEELEEPSGVAETGPSSALVETKLLGQARRLVQTQPSQALQLAELHRKRYPDGLFSQEREVVAIDALMRLGRRIEAVRRADRFARTFPRSAYLPKVRKLVASAAP